MWTIFAPVRGHVTRRMRRTVSDNGNVIRYSVLVTQLLTVVG